MALGSFLYHLPKMWQFPFGLTSSTRIEGLIFSEMIEEYNPMVLSSQDLEDWALCG